MSFSITEKKMSKVRKWPSSVFLCRLWSIWRHVCRPCSGCLTYSVVIHLCHITPGLMEAACCSSFIQSVLTGWVCVDLGRSPGCLLLHWDVGRSPQTQFEIIKRLLVEMCDRTQDTHVHSFSQNLQASLNSFQFSNFLSLLKHAHLHPPLHQKKCQSPQLCLHLMPPFLLKSINHWSPFPSLPSAGASGAWWAVTTVRPFFALPRPKPPTSASHLNVHKVWLELNKPLILQRTPSGMWPWSGLPTSCQLQNAL